MTSRNNHLLRDDAVRRFITEGYVQVNAGLPASFHRDLYRKIETVLDEEGNPGNNILPRIPEIRRVFDQPSVRGALTSLLGSGYLMHPHRYCHLNKPGSPGQQWHKDDYIFDHNVRHARCRWVMAFYYPQDVSEDMGPTGILPGRQHHNRISDCDASRTTESALGLCGPAGTVSIVNFDSWHRATANVSAKNRYMLKFQFTRSREPAGPAWGGGNGSWRRRPGDGQSAVSEAVWNWMSGMDSGEAGANGSAGASGADGSAGANGANGANGPRGASIDRDLAALDDPDEGVRLQAAYALGLRGGDTVDALVERLRATSEEDAMANVPKNPANPTGGNPSELPAAYGLSAAGRPAVKHLEALLEDEAWWVRAAAADVLGDIGLPASSARPALLRSLGDDEAWVRRNASESVAVLGGFSPGDVPVLRGALADDDERVRRNIAFALARHPIHDTDLVDDLAARSVEDEGRYVRYYALAAAAKMAGKAGNESLWEAMLATRWCPLTTPKSAF